MTYEQRLKYLWKLLRQYQKDGARAIHDFSGRALLADEMGLGKTLQALYYAFRKKSCRPVVIVCPSSVKWGWEREATRHLGMFSEVLEGRKVPKKGLLSRVRHSLIILNYDILPYWLDTLKALNPQIVIIDECHYIKNRSSKRYKAVKSLVEGVPHVVGISGTPLTNRPAELWPILNILRPDKFSSFFTYAMKYCRPKKLPWGWTYGGAKNLDKLHKRLRRTCMIRRKKKDVAHELPTKTRITVPVMIKNREEYDFAATNFLGWLAQKSPAKAKRARRAEAMTRVGYLLRLVARKKVRAVYDWIENYLEESNRKLVVFTVNRPMIRALEKHFSEYGTKHVTVDGSVTGRKRFKAIRRFVEDDKVRLFFGNVRAAGVGIDGLQHVSNTTVFVDFPWTPGELVQAEDRIHRIGQKLKAFIYYLVAKNTIEEDLCALLQEKQTILDATLDGLSEDESDDLFSQLLNKIAA